MPLAQLCSSNGRDSIHRNGKANSSRGATGRDDDSVHASTQMNLLGLVATWTIGPFASDSIEYLQRCWPTTWPRLLSNGPPLLPGLIAASV
eukprot:2562097-Amphidinium_carterae.1